ncbi:MAG: Peptidoglycan synthase FtsI [Alphaproteobacteria bacterium MarineAlpha11_Bin1]|nr:MAG: Peptidoglycan synthase FtsI [Alphaproteobacteria bacterium MarineAlpha11_Bin1]
MAGSDSCKNEEGAMTDSRDTAPEKIRIEGDRKTAIETGRNRLMVAGALFLAAFFAIGVRVVDVSMFSSVSEPRYTRSISKTEKYIGRAEVMDRNGVLMATSLNTASLYANPRLVLDPEQAAIKLAGALPGINIKLMERKLRADRGFVWLRRHLTPRQQYAVNRLGIPALNFQREARRMYPLGALASHVLGFTDIDNKGLAGIERYFDKELRSRQENLTLSVDVRVQHVLEHELSLAMKKFSAIGAAGLVMDVDTAEIVAMASLPNFDPNQPGAIDKALLFNRTTQGVYEMGSTFKIFTTAMAFDAGTATMRSGYDATNPIRVARFVIRDFHAKKRWLSVPEIFMYSSNIGTVKMALEVGVKAHRNFLTRLGFLKPVRIELSETGTPLSPDSWREINSMTISFGHGLAISPLHLVAGVSAIVNGGIYRSPTLVRYDSDEITEGRRVISEETSRDMRRLMRMVVENGTGRHAAAQGYLVGGKTGTAEKVSGQKYKKKALISSFVAAFPINKPKYVVLAMLDEAKGNKETFGYATGGWVAAPAVGKIIRRIAPILDLFPQRNENDARRALSMNITDKSIQGRRVATH